MRDVTCGVEIGNIHAVVGDGFAGGWLNLGENEAEEGLLRIENVDGGYGWRVWMEDQLASIFGERDRELLYVMSYYHRCSIATFTRM